MLFSAISLLLIVMLALTSAFYSPRLARSGLRSMTMMAKKKKEFPPNPVAIVTGASRGIGRAIALQLGAAGCKVIVNYASSSGAAEDVCKEIAELGGEKGGSGVPIKANLGSVEEIRAMFNKVEEEVGPVNILVNNAGITNDMLVMMMKPDE
jgi:3-oxoacyl-[acyl-carrier protein] reductase